MTQMSFPTIPSSTMTDSDWELLWAPYAEDTYHEVLTYIQSDDTVLEIGAGDMRLSTQMARIARQVYAIEIQKLLVEYALEKDLSLLQNLTIIQNDARTYPFPKDITTAVLLMRHCTHFRLYADKLKSMGCKKLITNARWRTGLEVVDLQAPRQSFEQILPGWFACWCGNTGFKPGSVDTLTEENFDSTYEVVHCPTCFFPKVRNEARQC